MACKTKKMRRPIVWIIDDDIISRFAATYKIEQSPEDCEVIAYGSALEGLDCLLERLNARQGLPDIILLDLGMPVMDGWSFLDEMGKMDGPVKSIQVYILSAFTESRDRNLAKENPAIQGFFNKPLNTANVKNILGSG